MIGWRIVSTVALTPLSGDFHLIRCTDQALMTTTLVHVAAYSALVDARHDWDALVAERRGWAAHLIDAVLVESGDDTIRSVHGFWPDGAARGALAGAFVGLLQPPALVCGALAGGIGDRTITTLSGGVDRPLIQRLGQAIDQGPFAIVALEESRRVDASARLADHAATVVTHWPRAVGWSIEDIDVRVHDLRAALAADDLTR